MSEYNRIVELRRLLNSNNNYEIELDEYYGDNPEDLAVAKSICQKILSDSQLDADSYDWLENNIGDLMDVLSNRYERRGSGPFDENAETEENENDRVQSLMNSEGFSYSSAVAYAKLEKELENAKKEFSLIEHRISKLQNNGGIVSKDDLSTFKKLEQYIEAIENEMDDIEEYSEISYDSDKKIDKIEKRVGKIDKKIAKNEKKIAKSKNEERIKRLKNKIQELQEKKGQLQSKQYRIVDRKLSKFYKEKRRLNKDTKKDIKEEYDENVLQYWEGKNDENVERIDALSEETGLGSLIKRGVYSVRGIPLEVRVAYLREKKEGGRLNGLRQASKAVRECLGARIESIRNFKLGEYLKRMKEGIFKKSDDEEKGRSL